VETCIFFVTNSLLNVSCMHVYTVQFSVNVSYDLKNRHNPVVIKLDAIQPQLSVVSCGFVGVINYLNWQL